MLIHIERCVPCIALFFCFAECQNQRLHMGLHNWCDAWHCNEDSLIRPRDWPRLANSRSTVKYVRLEKTSSQKRSLPPVIVSHWISLLHHRLHFVSLEHIFDVDRILVLDWGDLRCFISTLCDQLFLSQCLNIMTKWVPLPSKCCAPFPASPSVLTNGCSLKLAYKSLPRTDLPTVVYTRPL